MFLRLSFDDTQFMNKRFSHCAADKTTKTKEKEKTQEEVQGFADSGVLCTASGVHQLICGDRGIHCPRKTPSSTNSSPNLSLAI